MFLSIIAIIISALGGFFLTFLWDDDVEPEKRLVYGAVIGTAMWGLVGFLIASIVRDLTVHIVFISLGITFFIPLFLIQKLKQVEFSKNIARLRSSAFDTRTVIYYAVWILVLFFVLRTAFREIDGGYFTSYVDNYSDATLHTGIALGFSEGQNYPPEHPDFAGTRLTYPFLFDFISAMYLELGASLTHAFFLGHFLFMLLLIRLIDRFASEYSQSNFVGKLTPILILMTGGLGFMVFFKELFATPGSAYEFLLKLPHEYTIYGEQFKWGSAIVNWFIPMRSLLLGVALFMVVVSWWWRRITDKNTSIHLMWGAGFVASLMPLAHGHSYVILMFCACILSCFFLKKREWVRFFIGACVFAVPQILWVSQGSQTSPQSFFGWLPGWMSGQTNFFWFWFLNLGLFLPLLFLGLTFKKILTFRQRLFYLPFGSLFIIANLFRLAPWEWDNTKVFLYFCVFSSPIVAMVLKRVWQQKRVGKWIGGALVIILTLSGVLDVWHVAIASNNWVIFDPETREMGELVKKNTPLRSIILVAPHINHPVLLSGRQTFMGYTGRLWTHGLSYSEREQEVKRMYAEGTGAMDLFKKYNIEYILLGDGERYWASELGLTLDETFITALPLVTETSQKKLYQVTKK